VAKASAANIDKEQSSRLGTQSRTARTSAGMVVLTRKKLENESPAEDDRNGRRPGAMARATRHECIDEEPARSEPVKGP
jgi:hypothetical protein